MTCCPPPQATLLCRPLPHHPTGCWCAPKDCHGDFLASVANAADPALTPDAPPAAPPPPGEEAAARPTDSDRPTAALPSWGAVATAGHAWAAPWQPRPGDVPLVFYRDHNSWCTYSMRVWFALEQKGLRYTTERIPLAARAKPRWYRTVVPTGKVPALRIGGEVVWESLDILRRLEEAFPEHGPLLPRPAPARAAALAEVDALAATVAELEEASKAWLGNRDPAAEEALRRAALRPVAALDRALGARGGPFFCGAAPSLADAVCVGKLQQLSIRLPFFKGCALLTDRDGPYARIARWFEALATTPGYRAIQQEACFDQRAFHAHPDRRARAPRFLQLGPRGSLVGEPPDCAAALPPAPVAPLAAGTAPALEAAWRLSENREALADFLVRKAREAAGAGRGGLAAPIRRGQREELDEQLRAVAAVLAGLMGPGAAAAAVGGGAGLRTGPIAGLGALVGTPRDMSAAAAAQLRGAMRAMTEAAPDAEARRGAPPGDANVSGTGSAGEREQRLANV